MSSDRKISTERARKRSYFLFGLFLLLAVLACGGQETLPADGDTTVSSTTPTPDEAGTLFIESNFQIPLPDWPEVASADQETLITVASSGQAVAVGRHEALPRALGRAFVQALPGFGDFKDITLDDKEPNRVVVEALLAGEVPQQVRFVFIYCQGASYQLTGSAPVETFIDFEPLFERLLLGATCRDQPELVRNNSGLVGLIINPENDDYEWTNFRSALAEARASGVQATHTYLPWNEVEKQPGLYDWQVADHLIDTPTLEGLRLSLVINFIHTSVPGQTPDDLQSKTFDDPEYAARAATFAAAVAERYGDQLDFLALGNEVNIYFANHPEDLEPYLQTWQEMREAIREVRPDLPTGTTLAFHEAINNDRFDLIETFKESDFLAYTYYPHGQGFRYDGDTGGFGLVLEQMIDASGETPFLIVENGWATAASLGGSEAKQAAYLTSTFKALTEHRDSFDRHIWYNLHDGRPESCATSALSFFPPDFDPFSL